MRKIYIDADACPVKDEVYRVAKRCGIRVVVVANSWMRVPEDGDVEFVQVGQGFDEADEWIIDHCAPRDVIVTTDIPLAAGGIAKGASAINPKGRVFTEENIGDALAGREVSSQLREHGMMSGGPAPFNKKDRSRFLDKLDMLINRA